VCSDNRLLERGLSGRGEVQSQLETLKTESKIRLRRYRRRGEGNIKTDIKEVMLESVDYIYWVGM
jgi:hypothetical protein